MKSYHHGIKKNIFIAKFSQCLVQVSTITCVTIYGIGPILWTIVNHNETKFGPRSHNYLRNSIQD